MGSWGKPMEVWLVTKTLAKLARRRAEPRIAGMNLMILIAVDMEPVG
jgi:hypothetical protein